MHFVLARNESIRDLRTCPCLLHRATLRFTELHRENVLSLLLCDSLCKDISSSFILCLISFLWSIRKDALNQWISVMAEKHPLPQPEKAESEKENMLFNRKKKSNLRARESIWYSGGVVCVCVCVLHNYLILPSSWREILHYN